uniref:microsomal triglyceride transfer protein large subunit-like n=1 Tax=Myxine glutinosa TaxID=7769 RepID=UPI00358E9F40
MSSLTSFLLVLYSTCYIVLLSKICASPEDLWDHQVPSRGETRSYYYRTAIVTTQNGYTARNTDLQLEARADVAGLWDGETEEGDKLLRLILSDVKISSGRKKHIDVRNRRTADLDVDRVLGPGATEHLSAETLFCWRRGQVQGIYVLPNETEVITNIRRGFISLFQFQLQPGEVKETGLFGVCRVRYSVQPGQVTKHVIPGSCQLSHLKSAGLSQVLEWEFLSQVEFSFAFRNGVLTTANCLEHHVLKLPIQESVSINATSWQEMQLQSTNTGLFTGAWTSREEALNASVSDHVWKPLAAATLPGICLNCVKPKEAIKSAKKLLAPEHVASVGATRAFLQLSQVLRSTSASRILTLLRKEPPDTL